MAVSGIHLATAYVSMQLQRGQIRTDTSRELGKLERSADSAGRNAGTAAGRSFASRFASHVKNLGARIGGGLWRGLKTTLKVGAAGIGVAAGAALVGGFKSAIDQQNSQKVLAGLYGSTKQAEQMMKSLRKVSSQSSLDYSSYTKAAQSLAYAGVKGKAASKTLKNVGLAITAAGGDDQNLNRATDSILKMVNAGKVQLDTLQQLSDAGVPILSGLAKHFGVSIATVNKMASKGKIKLDDVLSVMKNGTGKTFQQMISAGHKANKSIGNTWKRIKDNITTSIGAAMVPILNDLTPAFAKAGNAVQKLLDKELKKLPGLIDKLKNHWREFKQGFTVDLSKEGSTWQKWGSRVRKIFDKVKGAAKAIGKAFESVKSGDARDKIADAFKGIDFGKIKKDVTDFVKNIDFHKVTQALQGFGQSAPIFNASLKLFGKALGFVGDHAKTIGALVPAIIALVVAGKAMNSAFGPNSLIGYNLRTAALLANAYATRQSTAATHGSTLAQARERIATLASAAAHRVASAASRAFAIAQRLVRAAMMANPIILVVTALIALGAAFVIAWKKSETFRNIVKGAWNGIKRAALAVWHWMTGTLWPGIKKVWDKISGAFDDVRDAISTAWDKIKGYFSTAWGWVKGFFKKHWMTIASILLGPVAIVTVQIYKHWNTIKGYFSKAWGWVKTTFKKLWNGAKKIVMWPVDQAVSGIETGWKNIKHNFRAAWDWAKGTFKTLWRGAKAILMWPVDQAESGIKTGWKNIKHNFSAAWGWVKGTFKRLWHGVEDILKAPIRAIKGFLDREVRGWKRVFRGAKTAIKDVWNGMKSIVKKPISWVVHHVMSPLISGINKIIPGSGPIPTGWMKGLADGGTVAGARRPYRDKRLYALAPGEEVITNRRGEADRFRAMRDAGMIPGLASGGRVPGRADTGGGVDRRLKWSGVEWYRPWLRNALIHVLRNLQNAGWSVLEMDPFTRRPTYGHDPHSLHYLGQAADISRPGMRGADAVARLLMSDGFGVKWGVPGHLNHIHVDTSLLDHLRTGWKKIGSATGSAGGWFDGLKDKVGGWISSAVGKFGGSWPVKMATAPLKGGVSKLFSWAADKMWSTVKNVGTGIWHGLSGYHSHSDVVKIVREWAAKRGWDNGAQWNAIAQIVSHESSWNPRADNPNSQAYGLFQANPGSKMAWAGPRWATDPGTQAKWGMSYIAGRYGTPVKAWRFWRAHHWYADGGRPPVGVPSVVGERGAELFVPDRPGTVLSHRDAMESVRAGLSDRDIQRIADAIAQASYAGTFSGAARHDADQARSARVAARATARSGEVFA